MIYGVLLVYYDQYCDRAIEEFRKLLDMVDLNHQLIVVSNNPSLKRAGVKFIPGDVLSSEFSGFDAGVKAIECLTHNDFVIFCNDTFCHHRRWGYIERLIFSSAFRSAVTERFNGVLGEVDTLGQNFEILNCATKSWVSTYLFGMSGNLLEGLNRRLSMDEAIASSLVYESGNGELFWDNQVSGNLKAQLTSWVSEGNNRGWYRKGAPSSVKLAKVRSILSEIYLSAKVLQKKYAVRDVYSSVGMLGLFYILVIRVERYLKGMKILGRFLP